MWISLLPGWQKEEEELKHAEFASLDFQSDSKLQLCCVDTIFFLRK